MTFQFDPADRDSPTPPLHPFEASQFTSSRHPDDDQHSFFETTPPDQRILFVDQVATLCKLDEARRDDLHSFRELIGDELPTRLAQMHIYQQGLMLQTHSMLESAQLDRAAVSEMVTSVKKVLSNHFEITPAQKDEIIFACKRLIMQPTRVDFDFKEEVLADLRKRKDAIGLTSCFEHHTRTKTLRTVVGQSVSYVKNLLRMHVRDTLYGADPRGVTDATREAMKKFVGQGKQPDAKDVIYMLFIRDHARRNRALLDKDNAVEGDGPLPEEGEGRRKRKRGGGRPAAGSDFWAIFSSFLMAKGKEWGGDIVTSAGWRSYIEDCLTAERQHFPTDTISLLPSTTIGMNQVDPGSQYSGPANTAVPPQRHTRSILTSAGSQNMAPNHAPPRSLRGLLL